VNDGALQCFPNDFAIYRRELSRTGDYVCRAALTRTCAAVYAILSLRPIEPPVFVRKQGINRYSVKKLQTLQL
jgi:hypothetical protein